MINEENLREAVLENVEYYKKFDKGEEIIEEKINRLEDFLGNDLSVILNFFFNKILGLIKSIILFIKDKIVEILMDLFYKYVRPLIINWLSMLLLERLEYWLTVVFDALNCLPTMMFSIGRGTVFGNIDNVEYADIVTPQNIPESKSEC